MNTQRSKCLYFSQTAKNYDNLDQTLNTFQTNFEEKEKIEFQKKKKNLLNPTFIAMPNTPVSEKDNLEGLEENVIFKVN